MDSNTYESSTLRRGLSCLLPVYEKDDPDHLSQAIESILNQTRLPDELIIVEDGPLNQLLNKVLSKGQSRVPTVRVQIPQNVGLGLALGHALNFCQYDLIARMDSDDVARSDRFEIQERYLRQHAEVILLGGSIEEFNKLPGDLERIRRSPKSDLEIRQLARKRNPFNHVTVVFRKQAVQTAGGYLHNPGFEDYELWLRLLRLPGKVENLPDVLVDVRAGSEMLRRRRGWSYLKTEIAFLRSAGKQGLLSTFDMMFSAILRTPARLVPEKVLGILYERLLRQRK